MNISVEQAAGILDRTEDEVLYIALVEKRLNPLIKQDDDIIYNEDGTVSFVEGNRDPVWELNLDEVLKFKQEMEQELAGEIEEILEKE